MRKEAQLVGILHMLATAVLMLLTTELVNIARQLLAISLEGR
jgi:hypothetical protein